MRFVCSLYSLSQELTFVTGGAALVCAGIASRCAQRSSSARAGALHYSLYLLFEQELLSQAWRCYASELVASGGRLPPRSLLTILASCHFGSDPTCIACFLLERGVLRLIQTVSRLCCISLKRALLSWAVFAHFPLHQLWSGNC